MVIMTDDAEKTKRKVHRSPGYPVFGLKEAIQKAEAVYQEEKRTATTPDVIASHIGYSQAAGPGGRAVSALRQYGLIEETSGRYRISELGYTLIHFDHNSDEWKRAVSEAAKRPTLFKELIEKYGNSLPSDATLRNELLGRGFNPTSIPDVVSIFRDTMSLASLAGDPDSDYTVAEERAAMPTTPSSGSEVPRLPQPQTTVGSHANAWTWTLSIPRNVRADLRIAGDVTRDDVRRLKKQIEFLEESFEEEKP